MASAFVVVAAVNQATKTKKFRKKVQPSDVNVRRGRDWEWGEFLGGICDLRATRQGAKGFFALALALLLDFA